MNTTRASIGSSPANVIAAAQRGTAKPYQKINKRSVQRAIRKAEARGERYVVVAGVKVTW